MTRRSFVPVCLTAAALVAAAGTPAAQSRPPQSPAPTFRVESNYVEVAAYVTDGAGRFVGDLDVNAFEVLEDGKPQAVSTFARVELPISAPAAAPVAAFSAASEEGTATNERHGEGRAFAVLVDSLHVSAQQTVLAKRVLRQFVTEHMGAHDQAAIVHVGRPSFNQDFTSDRTRLLASINGIAGEKIRSRMLTKWDEQIRQARTMRDTRAGERAANARQSIDALHRLVAYMAGMRGRRTAILYVSEGLDMNLNDLIGEYPSKQMQVLGITGSEDGGYENSQQEAAYAGAVVDELRSAMQAATRANVAVYTVDPRGLADASDTTIELVGTIGEGAATGSPAETFIPTAALRREFSESQHFLRSIAEQTGGRAIVSTNNFRGGFEKIIRDSSAYYVLGYQAPRRTDGKFRRIAVRAKRPGLNVWARKGYFSTRDSSPAASSSATALDVLQASPMAIPGLRMRAASAVLPAATSGGTVRFVVELDGRDLAFTERDGKFNDTVDLAYSVIDLEGNIVRRATKTLTLALSSATHAAVTTHGLRYTADVALPTGRHQIRLAAIEANAQKSGSIFWNVTVPNFTKADLAMSPVVVGSATTDQAPTINDAAPVPSLMPGLMTATRTFDRADTLSFATIMWDSPPAADCGVTVRVVGESGAEVFRTSEVSQVVLTGGAGRFLARLPLASFESGHYQLIVEARSPAAKRPVQQSVVFTVR